MKKVSASLVVLATLLVAGQVARAHDMSDMPAKPGSPEFQELKQLVGKWQGTATPPGKHGMNDVVTTEFRLTAAGSAVEETLFKGTPQEMVDMYTDQNGRLSMTHYCAMGNQPHLVAQSGAAPHSIALEMVASPGIGAKDSHMHALTLEFPDNTHLTERWTSYTNGRPNETTVFNFTRVQ